MTTNAESVWRNLPSVYRRAGTLTPAYGLTTVLGRMLVNLERTAQDVLRTRYLDHVPDLEDLTQLAAWFQLSPWPDEDTEAFRHRVRRMVAIYREGAANATRMIDLVGVAMSADMALIEGQPAIFFPRLTEPEWKLDPTAMSHGPWPQAGTIWASLVPAVPSPYAVYAIFIRKLGNVTWAIPVALLDLPKQQVISSYTPDTALGHCEWKVDPPVDGLGDDPAQDTYGSPVVTITAPTTHAVSMPVLVQRDLRRLVVINRLIQPGQAVRVDLTNFLLVDVGTGPASTTVLAGRPDLLFGTGALLGEHKLGQGPPPFRLLKLYTQGELEFIDGADPVMSEPGPAGETLLWAPLLTPLPPGQGPVHWRLLLGQVTPTDGVFLVQPTLATTVEKIDFAMVGRWPGTFSLIYDESQVLGKDPADPLEHRATWLNEQIHRLKLAGVIYLRETEIFENLGLPPAIFLGEKTVTSTSRMALQDSVTVHLETSLNLTEEIHLSDGLLDQLAAQVILSDEIQLGDELLDQVEVQVILSDEMSAQDGLGVQQSLNRSSEQSDKLLMSDKISIFVQRRQTFMAESKVALVGRVQMTVTGKDGVVRLVVEGHNTVLRAGRALAVAQLGGQASAITYRIGVGADGTPNANDDLKDLNKPLPVELFEPARDVPVPMIDVDRTMFQLSQTFSTLQSLSVAESGIYMTTPAVRSTDVPSTILYNRAVVTPDVVLRPGDKLTVNWTVLFTSV